MASMPNNVPPQEIRISEDMLQKIGLILLGLSVIFVFLGVLVSPRDDQEKPILLMPDVKAVQDYRHTARAWIEEFSDLDRDIDRMIRTGSQGDIFTQSHTAQDTLQHAVDMAQQVDRANVPQIAMGLHDEVLSTAIAYLEPARSALQWISAPDQKNHDLAVQYLETARQTMDKLEANEWLIAR